MGQQPLCCPATGRDIGGTPGCNCDVSWDPDCQSYATRAQFIETTGNEFSDMEGDDVPYSFDEPCAHGENMRTVLKASHHTMDQKISAPIPVATSIFSPKKVQMGRKCPPPSRWETVSPPPPPSLSPETRLPVEEVNLVPARIAKGLVKLDASGGSSPKAPPARPKMPGNGSVEVEGEAPPDPPDRPCSQLTKDDDDVSV